MSELTIYHNPACTKSRQTLDDIAWIKAMVTHPILIERPIVVRGNAAAIGRPPQNVAPLLR